MEHYTYRTFNSETNEEKFDVGAQTQFPGRPEGMRLGKPVTIRVNQFKVLQWPQDDIYQYDVSLVTAIRSPKASYSCSADQLGTRSTRWQDQGPLEMPEGAGCDQGAHQKSGTLHLGWQQDWMVFLNMNFA